MKQTLVIALVIVVVGLLLLWVFGYLSKQGPGYIAPSKIGTCDVCKYAKGDLTHRQTQYCPTCDAWICPDCSPNYPLRAVAMANKKLAPYFGGNYE